MRFWITVLTILLSSSNLTAAENISIYCGAGLIRPVEEMRKNFEMKNPIEIKAHYGGSGELFGLIASGKPCDVFIPGAAKYIDDALKKGWVVKESIHDIVRHVPVIAVSRGNPAGIQTLEDLVKPGVKIALGDPRAAAIGRVARKMFTRLELYDALLSNTSVQTPTVNQLLVYVTLGQVDAAIIWEDLTAWGNTRGRLEVIKIPEKKNLIKTIPSAVTPKGRETPLALQFNQYISSPEGLAIWKKWGFKPCTE